MQELLLVVGILAMQVSIHRECRRADRDQAFISKHGPWVQSYLEDFTQRSRRKVFGRTIASFLLAGLLVRFIVDDVFPALGYARSLWLIFGFIAVGQLLVYWAVFDMKACCKMAQGQATEGTSLFRTPTYVRKHSMRFGIACATFGAFLIYAVVEWTR